MSEPRLRIAEVFTSVQGEGIWAGVPSTFVRVSGCNLRCQWCDTPYASWNPEGPFFTVAEILEQLDPSVNHVVLTGGEPMLFDPIEDLATRLKARGHTITIETAGTIFRDLPCDLMSISPKLANSTPEGDWSTRHDETRANLTPLRQLIDRYSYQLKFVVNPETDKDDLAEIESLLAQLEGVKAGRILVMAEGTDSETLHRRERMMVGEVIRRGWRLCPRWHIDLFGNIRGT